MLSNYLVNYIPDIYQNYLSIMISLPVNRPFKIVKV